VSDTRRRNDRRAEGRDSPITDHGDDEIEAYLARPLHDGPRGGVVAIHHMPGYDQATKEMARMSLRTGATLAVAK
jgi:dienelactone hydrolase